MSKQLQANALAALTNYLDTLCNSQSPQKQKQADLIAYWIQDYTKMLSLEENFDPAKNIVYHRGDIVKVHFGYRIGSEQGGLHYAVVIDENAHNSPVITVIPLVSAKPGKRIHSSNIYLGNELYETLSSKCLSLQNELFTQLIIAVAEDEALNKKVLQFIKSNKTPGEKFIRIPDWFISELEESSEKLKGISEKLSTVQKIYAEISKMKQGSIAVVNQITTVSKIRIYDPRKTADVLSGIKLSAKNLDLINDKLKELFIHE